MLLFWHFNLSWKPNIYNNKQIKMKKTAFLASLFLKRASVSTNMWSVQKTSTENCMSCLRSQAVGIFKLKRII